MMGFSVSPPGLLYRDTASDAVPATKLTGRYGSAARCITVVLRGGVRIWCWVETTYVKWCSREKNELGKIKNDVTFEHPSNIPLILRERAVCGFSVLRYCFDATRTCTTLHSAPTHTATAARLVV